MQSFFNFVLRYWLRILITFLIASTVLWTCAIGLSFRNIATGFFYSLQFLVLNKDINADISGALAFGLIVMQISLPLLTSIGLVNSLFNEKFEPFLAAFRLKRMKEYVVVVGCGSVGSEIAKKFCSLDVAVLVIDKDHSNIHRSTLQESSENGLGFIWLTGDITDSNILKMAQINKASKIFVCTGDDSRNLQIFKNISSTLTPKKSANCVSESTVVDSTPNPDIRIQLASDAARDALRDWCGWLDITSGMTNINVSGFDVYELAAREIFNNYSPDNFHDTDNEGLTSQVVMVVGTGRMASALIRRAGRLGHFSKLGKLKLIWVDPEVESASKTLFAENPHLNPDINPKELNLAANDWKEILPSIDVICVSSHIGSALRQNKIKELSDQRLPAVVFICHADEAENANEAREVCAFYNRTQPCGMSENQGVIVAVQYEQTYGLSHNNPSEPTELKPSLPYRTEEVVILDTIGDVLADEKTDGYAKYFNSIVYSGETKKTKVKMNTEWSDLPEFLKESNRDLADHIAIKLRYIDAQQSAPMLSSSNTKLLLEHHVVRELSVIEHKRYCAYMFSAGYAYKLENEKTFTHPVEVVSLNKRLPAFTEEKHWQRHLRVNPTLLPYDDLTIDEKTKDKNMVDSIDKALNFWKIN